jgi:long-chain acyl-CoA synthetase
MTQLAQVIERFLDRVAERPDATAIALAESEQRWTYAELLGEIERWRGTLAALGVVEGEPVMVALPPSPELIASFYALVSLGAVVVPIGAMTTGHELSAMADDTAPVGFITNTDRLRQLTGSLEGRRSLRFVIVEDGAGGEADATDIPLHDRASLGARPAALTPPANDPVITCHFTYKGLGYPLGATHRYSHYAALLDGVARAFPHEPGERHLLNLPLHTVFGALAFLLPLHMGAEIVLAPGAREVTQLLAAHRVRLVFTVPAILRMMIGARKAGASAPQLHPELEIISGGSYMRDEVAAAFASALGVMPFQGYGLSETLPIITNRAGKNRPGSIGASFVEGLVLSAVDARGHALASDLVGELVVGGPTVTDGFWNRPAETAQFLRDGRFHTGDIVRIDDDGFVHFIGRRAPFTKIAAQMVDLVEIEEVLGAHAGVLEARAYTRMSPTHDEELHAAALVRHDCALTPPELLRACRQRLAAYKVPRKLRVVKAPASRAAALDPSSLGASASR